jgi:CHASE3 domain sensor protein
MDSSEKYSWLSLWLGLALVLVWSVMSLAHAYDRSLTTVSDSFTHGFMLLGRLGTIVDALDRLSVEERAFLSTGDERFQDGVIENAEALEINVDVLNSMAATGKSQRAALTSLFRSIKQVLDLVGESDGIRDARSGAAAAAFFESKESAVSLAKWQADQLRIEVTRGMSGRIRKARRYNALFEGFFYGEPAGTALGRGVAFWNSARLTGRVGTAGQAWTRP